MTKPRPVEAFSQSEKLKSALIWISQSFDILNACSAPERGGAEKALRFLVGAVAQEIYLTRRRMPDPSWDEAEKHLDLALVMMDSGVPREAVFHLTRALRQVTGVGHRSMTILKDQGLL
jgi:hypothetical protein